MRAITGILLGSALAALGLPAAGAERPPSPRGLAFGAGWFDVNRMEDPAAQFGVEYRAGERSAPVRPYAATMLTTDGAFYFGVGIGLDLSLGPRVVVTPSLGPGLYLKGGGKDLGFLAEFRSQIEVAYRFRNGSRLGLALSHLSNGSVGKRNPGEESLVVSYEVSFKRLFGR